MAPDNPMTTPGIIWRSDDLTTPIEGWRGTLEIRAGSAVDSTTGPLAELARLRAENERLKADAAAMADVFSRGHDEGINDCLRNGLDWAHEYMGGQPGKRAKSEQHPSDDNDVQRLRASMQAVIDAHDGPYENPGEFGEQVAQAIEDMKAAMPPTAPPAR